MVGTVVKAVVGASSVFVVASIVGEIDVSIADVIALFVVVDTFDCSLVCAGALFVNDSVDTVPLTSSLIVVTSRCSVFVVSSVS